MEHILDPDDREEHQYLQGVSDATSFFLNQINQKDLEIDEDLKEKMSKTLESSEDLKATLENAAATDRMERILDLAR